VVVAALLLVVAAGGVLVPCTGLTTWGTRSYSLRVPPTHTAAPYG